MLSKSQWLGLSVAALLGVASIGCSKSAPSNGANTETKDSANKITAALAQLSPEDRTAAEQQKICPVTEEPLGSMGKPLKMEVNDSQVFLCCGGCKDKLLADPEKYLAKLKNQ